MAEKKTGTARTHTQKKSAAKPKPSAGKAAKSAPREQQMPTRQIRDENSLLHRLLPYLYIVLAFLLIVCFIFHNSAVGGFLYKVCFGLFGLAAVLIAPMLSLFAAKWRKWVSEGSHILETVLAAVCLLLAATLYHLIRVAITPDGVFGEVGALWELQLSGGGVFGGLLAIGMVKAFQTAASIIFTVALLLAFGFALFGVTPKTLWINYQYARQVRGERRAAAAATREEREFAYEGEPPIEKPVAPEVKTPFETAVPKKDFDMQVDLGEPDLPQMPQEEDAPEAPTVQIPSVGADEDVDDEGGGEPIDRAAVAAASYYRSNGEIDLAAIFTDASKPQTEYGTDEDVDDEGGGEPMDLGEGSLSVTTETMGGIEPAPVEKPEYRFPPISLLAPPEKKRNEDVSAELRANAQKLIDTLRSFRVNVTISSVSRGPTITRYELIPEAGTRVRSIANLVDDISLSLATSGIRIEAPIPGKAAVGIEVPNKVVATVALRELIENKAFSEAKSKLSVCLGKDVGGAPIIFDIAKMPHLLIAGATGMGKSVCINSIITSILYKASPDEVKLILIDPKKVEFNIYNGIPHLQIPVVSEPKKAAGALHWAVNEMERRYELIEEVGARKIEPYNEIARARGLEVLPYTVIIIDELADLMMTAPDAVEDSICRLAQKARAAGMHIIIGTQRPSVDVITGLIKANIPSRIAFTVASQVDSRTILDIAGAEKLIGRGDMLYYPVGLSKPMRAQGAFVSEDEVERITAFVKEAVGETAYDGDVMAEIEREAQAIGAATSKRGGGEDLSADESADPKLRDALEIATDVGKISTSLLQRKLSIGYGRAAKIIDAMEARGFVSAPDGQKPREVLITKTQFREMVVNNDERLN